MNKTRIVTGAASAFGMLLLILDSKTAVSGATEGLELCIRTVIPSLFPFFVLSILLTGSLAGTRLPLLKPFCKILRIPQGSESILAAGLLGGYPVGAQSVSDGVRRGQLTREEARRMLAFCNNAGPAFLFGMASALFPCAWMPWALWGIHIFSAMMVGILIPGRSSRVIHPENGERVTLAAALRRSIGVMARVCGWVVLFRVVIAFFTHWFGWLLPSGYQVILAGILELSNGCCNLASINNIGMRFVICSGFLAFGGVCVMLQTFSVAEGLDTRLYFPGKVLQTLISVPLAMVTQSVLPDHLAWKIPPSIPFLLFAAAIFPFILTKMRNKSGNPEPIGV